MSRFHWKCLSYRFSPSRPCQPVTSHHLVTSTPSADSGFSELIIAAIILKTKRDGFQVSDLPLFPPSLPDKEPVLHLRGEEDKGGRSERDCKHPHRCCRHRPLLNSQGEHFVLSQKHDIMVSVLRRGPRNAFEKV